MSKLEVTYDYPNSISAQRLQELVGIDDKKGRLEKGLRMSLNPKSVDNWANKHHGKSLKIAESATRRPPLYILEGDVGVGKTALAESIGDAVARSEKIDVWLYRLSLSSRGSGMVGEITTHITQAFEQVNEAASKLVLSKGEVKGACILLLDEADALVQSRESAQMHHEDRAGVNAIIRGIDDISSKGLPVAVIMCTNRLVSIDPAVQRRAADILTFSRPNSEQRKMILGEPLRELKFTPTQIDELVKLSGSPTVSPDFTFSDLTQRFLPSLVVDAFPSKAISFARALEILKETKPTPVFKDNSHGE